MALTATQLDKLTRTVLGEAANQGRNGMVAVASVIKNRANSGRFGSSDPAVIASQPNQFTANNALSAGGNVQGRDASPSSRAYQQAEAAVRDVFNGTAADPTGGATYYHVTGTPASLANPVVTAQIGAHTFYVPPGGSALSAINSIVPQPVAEDALGYAANPNYKPLPAPAYLSPPPLPQPRPDPVTSPPQIPQLSPLLTGGAANDGSRVNASTSFYPDGIRESDYAPSNSSIIPQAFAGSSATGSAQAPPQVTFTGNGLSSQPTDFQQGNQDILGLLAGLAGAGGTSAAVRAVNAQQAPSAFAGSSATGQAKQSPFSGSTVTGNASVIPSAPSYAQPTTQYTTKAMTEANPAYEAYIKAQNADDIGSGPGSFSSLESLNTPSIVPPKTITVNQRVPLAPASIPLSSLGTVNPMSQILPNVASGFSSTPIGHIVQAVSGDPVSGGLLGLLFGGGTPSVLSQLTSAMQPTAAPAFPNSAGNGPVVGAKKTPDGYTTFNGDNGVPGNSGNWWASVTNQS